MKKTSTTSFEVIHNDRAIISGLQSETEAIKSAIDYKNDPINHNGEITEKSIEFWENQTFTIVKKTVKTQEIRTI